MKRFVYTLVLSAVCCCVSFADEEASTPRRRPRIRVYDESPRLIPVTREPDSPQASRQDMDRRIRQDRPLSTGLQVPGGAFSPIPSLIEPQWVPPREESSEEQDTGWINPLEFLSEEDLYEVEGLESESMSDDPEPEIEITAWEDLQKEMFKQTLSPDSDEKPTMEELVEMTLESNEKAEEQEPSRGLDLEPVAPLDSPESFNEVTMSGAQTRDRTDVSLFTPILRMETRGRETSGTSEYDRGEPVEFSGSRALFNQIKENQAPASSASLPASQPDRSFARPQFEPMNTATEPARVRSAALPGAGLSGANALQSPRALPGEVGNRNNTRTSLNTIQEPRRTQPESERFRPSENRIRSQLGPVGGLGL